MENFSVFGDVKNRVIVFFEMMSRYYSFCCSSNPVQFHGSSLGLSGWGWWL